MIRPRGEKIKEEVAFILILNLPTSLLLYYNPDFIATGEMGSIKNGAHVFRIHT